MKLRFEPDLDFQHDAIAAVVDLFAGQDLGQSLFTVAAPSIGVAPDQGHLYDAGRSDSGYANALALPPETILNNLRAVQLRNGLRQDAELQAGAAGVEGQPAGGDYAVEMETGTGKTYVYLRTMLELHRRYGWTKFLVVVPSVAIKQGVLKSLEMMREHFRGLYDGVAMEHEEYEGSAPARVRNFATSRNLRVLVATVQGLYEGRKIDEPTEKLGGERPLDLIRRTNPVVILDEPQSIEGGGDGEGAKAIRSLHPLAVLRYSATHLRTVHDVYRLDAFDAFRRNLVKRIEVAGATALGMHNTPYVRLVDVKTRKGSEPKAVLELDCKAAGDGVIRAEKTLTNNQWLDRVTGRSVYEGLRLGNIRGGRAAERKAEIVTPDGFEWLGRGESIGGIDAATFTRMLIERTLTEHLDKELRFRRSGRNLKVLTLFFVERVADYVVYDAEGRRKPGPVAQAFEEIYRRKQADPKYAALFGDESPAADKVHEGYFAAKRKQEDADGNARFDDFMTASGKPQSNAESREAERAAFELIMKKKEQLLSHDEPVRFIFSHSALREGWDNPNVFQVCSLRAMGSQLQRRQSIGRGLRLCVGPDGERVRDENVNVLTVIAGESLIDFAAKLQQEYEDDGVTFGTVEPHAFATLAPSDADTDAGTDAGLGLGPMLGQTESERLHAALQAAGYLDASGLVTDALRRALKDKAVEVPSGFDVDPAAVVAVLRERAGRKLDVADADEKQTVRPQRAVIDSEEFRELWERVRDRTTYRVRFDSGALVDACVASIKKLPDVERARIRWETGGVGMLRSGINATESPRTKTEYVNAVGVPLPDVIGLLQERTGLTRATVAQVILRSGRVKQLAINPQAVIKLIGDAIETEKKALMVGGIEYERTGAVWAQDLFDAEFEGNLKRLMEAGVKSATDYVRFDSGVEADFLGELQAADEVKLFAKLPTAFHVRTPLGKYNPDWAVLVEQGGEQRLYFVVETKSSPNPHDRRREENLRIDCGDAHFAALNNHQKASGVSGVRYRVHRTLGGLLASE